MVVLGQRIHKLSTLGSLQLDHKGGALAWRAFAPDLAVHSFHHPLHDREPQAGGVFARRGFGAQTRKLPEQLPLIFDAEAWMEQIGYAV